jgi:hypothetical protein
VQPIHESKHLEDIKEYHNIKKRTGNNQTPEGYNSIDVEAVQKDHESKKKMRPRKTLDYNDQNQN